MYIFLGVWVFSERARESGTRRLKINDPNVCRVSSANNFVALIPFKTN